MYDMAIVGSGIGGALFASQYKNKNIILFEKDSNLGGCAQTFTHKGYLFNAGATTFAGYEENHIVKEFFDKAQIKPNLKNSTIAFRVIQKENIIDRTKDFTLFLENIEKVYPNKNNLKFWKTIKDLDEKFWKIKNIYYAKYSLFAYLESLKTGIRFFDHYGFDLFKSADGFIKDILGDISKEYQDFIDATLMITVQQKSKDVPLLFLALGLAYPFHDLYYPVGGMGKIFDTLLEDCNLQKKEAVIDIEKHNNHFKIKTDKGDYLSKKVILNTTVFDSKKLFSDKKIQRYYDGFEEFDQSAFVVYMKLNTTKELLHHYQIILKKNIPNCVSNSFFVSLSDKDDQEMSKDGLSVTISTHTKVSFWKNLSKQEYKKEKEKTVNFIIDSLIAHLPIEKGDVRFYFGASPNTYNRYIGRYNCGGIPNKVTTILNNSGVSTPFKNLYQVGDTTMGAQGWPGVALGVRVLERMIQNG